MLKMRHLIILLAMLWSTMAAAEMDLDMGVERQPPFYFRGWMPDAPPHWGDHWGLDWEQQRSGWDRWNPRAILTPAPLPRYQRHYSGNRYPRELEQQYKLERQRYQYRPRDPEVWRHYREHSGPGMPAQRNPRQQDFPQYWPDDPANSRFRSPRRGSEDFQQSTPDFPQQERMNIHVPPEQQPQKVPTQREQWAPSATDQQDNQDWNGATRMPKK